MPHVDRDGVRIAYHVRGDGARGQTLLFTHGFGSSSHVFADNAAALAPRHTVVAWDLRGHAGSDAPSDEAGYSIDVSIGDMAAILDAAGAERAVLVGHSLGGYLSLTFALDHPDRVSGLVVFGSGPGFRNADARAGWNAMAERYAAALDERGLDGLPGGEELRRDVHPDARGLALAARGILQQQDARVLDGLPTIDVPTLVVVGERDSAFLAGSSYMAGKIPDAQLVVVPGAGHAVNITHPAAFDQAVIDFVDRVPTAR